MAVIRAWPAQICIETTVIEPGGHQFGEYDANMHDSIGQNILTMDAMATPQKNNSSSRKRKKWKPTASSEARRLLSTEDDWNLATGSDTRLSRTRGKKVVIKRPPTPQDIVHHAIGKPAMMPHHCHP